MIDPDDGVTLGLGEGSIPNAPGRLPFERVGPYRLIRSLGAGGMGEVFLAERDDGSFRQEVALKLVPFSLSDGERAVRLRHERQVLAQLEHPNLARLLDGGIAPDGTPYLAMEYVRGEPLRDWLSRRRPGLVERLQRFLELCAAVSYAHQRLIVHRDIKPGNIMVDEAGKARLLDFGIAKLLAADRAEATLTAAGSAVMTAAYSAPEQVLGQPITTATDVYQLGLVLYEMLTGAMAQPVSHTSRASEIERFICRVEPQRPSRCTVHSSGVRLSGRYAGDLDTVVMAALHKEPGRRYASVEALAEDVRRILARQPILARRDNLAYRARRFVERHALASAASLLALLALVGFGLYERHLRGEADQARTQAERSLEDRDQALVQARAAQARAESVQGFLVDMFSGAQASGKGRELRVVDVLDGAERSSLERIDADPDTALALIAALAKVRQSLGQYNEVGTLLDAAVPALEHAVGEDDERVLELLNVRSAAADYLGDYPLKFALNERRYQRLVRSRGERDAATQLALFDVGVSRYFLDRKDPRAWEEMTTSAAAVAEALGADDPRALEVARYEVQFLYVDRRYEAAIERGMRVHPRAEAALGPAHPTTLNVLSMIGLSHDGLGRWREALALVDRMDALVVEHRGPGNSTLANSRNRRGLALMALGDIEAGIESFESAIAIGSSVLGPNHPVVLMARANMATALGASGRHERAIELTEAVRVEREKTFGANSLSVAMTVMDLAVLQAAGGDFRSAAASLDTARAMSEAMSEDDLRSAEWLPVRMQGTEALVRAWEHGPAALGEAFPALLEQMRAYFGLQSSTYFGIVYANLRAMRVRHGSLPPEVEAFLEASLPDEG